MKKRKIFTVVLIFSILMATLAGCDKADKVSDTTKKPVIKIGSDNYPPYNFLNEDGIPTGIDVELATEAFRRMGYRTEIVQINWEKKKELVESGKIDCIMGCFSMEGRLNDYRWAGPYIASRQVVAVNENSDIHKLSDLKGKNLAVHILLDKLEVIAQNALVDRNLLKGLGIHEIVQVSVAIQILHVLALYKSGWIFIVRVEGLFRDGACDDVANLGADESSAFAGFHVLKLDDGNYVAIHLKRHAISKISCRYHDHILQ